MAFRKDGRWVVEAGDRVYWRNDLNTPSDEYVLAKVALITDRHVYLEAGPHGKVETWRILVGAAPLHIIPRVACYVRGRDVFYDWSQPPIVSARRKTA